MSYTTDDEWNIFDEYGKKMVPGMFGNYIGPKWSNGEFQDSVEWGDKDPQDELDLAAYYHDSAYAKYKDSDRRYAADRIFVEEAKKIGTPLAKAAAELVEKGNIFGNGVNRLKKNVEAGMVAGGAGVAAALAVTAVQNIYEANKRLPGGTMEKTIKEVEAYYATDPHKRKNMFNKAPPEIKEIYKIIDPAEEALRVEREKPKYEKLAQEMRAKNQKHAEEMKQAAERHRAHGKSKSTNQTVPLASPEPTSTEEVPLVEHSPEDIAAKALFRPVSHKIAVAPAPGSLPSDAPIPVSEGLFSGLARMFKKKKKKKNKTAPSPGELAERQAQHFKRYNQLRQQAEASELRSAHATNQFKFYGPGQARIDRLLSEKRLKQARDGGGWRSK